MTPSTKVPHSWNYNPNLDSVRTTAPTITMKSRLSQGMVKNKDFPGPGNYGISNATRKAAPSFGFGSSTRNKGVKKLNVPGPGTYKLVNSIGDLPAYALPEGRNDKYRFI